MSKPMAEDELDKILGESFGMWLVNDGVEWLDTGEWHIGDGVDDCSGTDGTAQLESYKKAKAAINAYTTNKIIEARKDELLQLAKEENLQDVTDENGVLFHAVSLAKINIRYVALNHRKE